MGHAGKLIPNSFNDFRMPVTVDVCPDRGISVEVFASAAVAKDGPLPLDQDHRFMVVGAPRFHLGERMPTVGLVQSGQGFGIPNVSHRGEKYPIPSGT